MKSEYPKQLELFPLPKIVEQRFYLSKNKSERLWITNKMELSPYLNEAKSYKIGASKAAIHQLQYKFKNLELLEKQGKQWFLHFRVKQPTIWKPGVWQKEPIQIICNRGQSFASNKVLDAQVQALIDYVMENG